MKNSFSFHYSTTLQRTPIFQFFIIIAFLLVSSHLAGLHAQTDPVLSIQGVLKKSSGEAVPDGVYDLTFRLYKNPDTGQPVWTETQTGLEVISGIYSTVLGNSTQLSIAFDTIYYLGVTVGQPGSSEMKPRVQLTSAPYSLALIGESNKFPSSGTVKADTIVLKGGVLARAGIPGNNGSNHSGYGFSGNNGQKDSGLFSTPTSGNVSLYVDNSEKLKVTADSVVIEPNLRLAKGSNINYNGLDDWRLVEADYLETGAEGWKIYSPPNPNPPIGAWKQTNGIAATVTTFNDAFAGKALMPTTQGQVFKKQFTLPGGNVAGTYTYVKVVFNYYYLNSWDLAADENGWAAFSKTEDCTELSVGWFDQAEYVSAGNNLGNNQGQFGPAANFVNGDQGGNPAQWSDQWKTEEMIGRYPSGPNNSNFYVIFGNANNEGVGSENYAVGMIEIWVK